MFPAQIAPKNFMLLDAATLAPSADVLVPFFAPNELDVDDFELDPPTALPPLLADEGTVAPPALLLFGCVPPEELLEEGDT